MFLPEIYSTIEEMRSFLQSHSRLTLGFVPTMGSLHQGHLSLIARSIQENHLTFVSIFVNPTQFGPNEDFQAYPRDLAKDQQILADYNISGIFAPEVTEFFPAGYQTYINVECYSDVFCGASRPGHFRGVATVVSKFLHILSPKRIYLGEKDYQQVIVLEKMIADLNMPTKVVRCPIVREPDGLAMSSRNAYLNPQERQAARCLYQSLLAAREMYQKGITDVSQVKKQMIDIIVETHDCASPEYIEFVHNDILDREEVITDNTRVIMAVRIGKTRLIDNMRIREM